MSLDNQIACVKREIAMREIIYPKRVAAGKMREDRAREELKAMREVLETLKTLEEQ